MQDIASPPLSQAAPNRDPVAAIVEERLNEFARNHGGEITAAPDESGKMALAFNGVMVAGENRDIAILRLASALLDDPRFTVRLTRSLGSVITHEASGPVLS